MPLICPVCKQPLLSAAGGFCCAGGHRFDTAREGYVNLLTGNHKPGSDTGDNRDMAHARRAFLESGAYAPLATAVGDTLAAFCPPDGTVLDICCGEGYYTAALSARFPDRRFFGFDISKEMVRLAAKQHCNAQFFVANLASIPLDTGSMDAAFHLFAPFHAEEFARVLHSGGQLISAIPGRQHLMGLKSVLYEQPYENDEQAPSTGALVIEDRIRVRATLQLHNAAEIQALLRMTPYYYHTPTAGLQRLSALTSLETPIEFVLLLCRKP